MPFSPLESWPTRKPTDFLLTVRRLTQAAKHQKVCIIYARPWPITEPLARLQNANLSQSHQLYNCDTGHKGLMPGVNWDGPRLRDTGMTHGGMTFISFCQ
eukprot:COSAG02_NODE_3561_length_6554_cov_66.784308_5_plen_100_part_00